MSTDDLHRYDDLLALPHHVSATRPPMAMADRAAQFAPFSALTGYETAVSAAADGVAREVALRDRPLDFSTQLHRLEAALDQGQRPKVTICLSGTDSPTSAWTGFVQQLDPSSRLLVLTDGTVLSLDCIVSLDGALFSTD